jgi:hypothetical protein
MSMQFLNSLFRYRGLWTSYWVKMKLSRWFISTSKNHILLLNCKDLASILSLMLPMLYLYQANSVFWIADLYHGKHICWPTPDSSMVVLSQGHRCFTFYSLCWRRGCKTSRHLCSWSYSGKQVISYPLLLFVISLHKLPLTFCAPSLGCKNYLQD